MESDSFLEETLLERGLIEQVRLDKIREYVGHEKGLADVLAEQKVLDEDQILNILAEYFGLPTINLNFYFPEEEVIALVSKDLCDKFKVFPLFKIKNTIMLATSNPSDVHAMDEVRVKCGMGIEPVLALPSSIENAIQRYYGAPGESVNDVLDIIVEEESSSFRDAEQDENVEASDEPVVRLVNLLIAQSVRDRASDIHINPEKDTVRVRYRIDGILHDLAQPPKKLQDAVISRLKILANLDIAERRVPQDGRIELKIDKKPIDLRVSTLPTIYGENVVMRILDKSSVLVELDDIGFSDLDLKRFRRLIAKPNGVILTSGPTGSGKTTTLYAALGSINTVDRNIITLEDPVEYNLPLIRQSQINTRTGYTFAHGLRAILRQDPDVILVGEIRDLETAAIAVEAAMTGHLVFSTLHTNDAPGCISRLAKMGVQDFLLATTMNAALAQRLVRRICPDCKIEYIPAPEILEDMEMDDTSGIIFYRGEGCNKCHGTGYRGRAGLYELMEVTPVLQDAIARHVPETELKKIAQQEGMCTLREDGIDKIRQGITTIDEVLRVTKL